MYSAPSSIPLITGASLSALSEIASNGILVYSTCTLNKKENSGQIKNFLKEHPEFTCIEERTVFPFEEHYDGFYIAKLTKNQE